MPTITPLALHPLLQADPALQIVDVRTPGEFASGHVPGARNFPLDQLDPARLAASGALLSDRPVYLLCGGGGRAARAAERFSQAGFVQPFVVEGGTRGWEKAGLSVDREAGGVISLERQVRIAAGALVVLGVALSWAVHPAFVLLAGFVGAGLVFAGVSDWCGLALLLAKLPWNRGPECGCGK